MVVRRIAQLGAGPREQAAHAAVAAQDQAVQVARRGQRLVERLARHDDGAAWVTFVSYLPNLVEGLSVNLTAINGIANEPFPSSDGSIGFTASLKSAVSAHSNTLGVYRISADGTIVDVHVVIANTLRQPARQSLFRCTGRRRAAVLMSAAQGALTATAVFHSSAGLNPGNAAQVLSGVAPGGRELLIGFEDLPTGMGDNDFQDVVIGVRTSHNGIFFV